jgi:hypothetical protein
MTLRNSARIAVIACAISTAPSLSYSAPEAKLRIYSNVEYNEEGGDLLGYELQIQLDGSRVSGFLRIYEGGCGNSAPVAGTLSAGKISLHGEDKFYGKVEISGTMSNDLVKATLRMENAAKPETIKLKPIAKPHC